MSFLVISLICLFFSFLALVRCNIQWGKCKSCFNSPGLEYRKNAARLLLFFFLFDICLAATNYFAWLDLRKAFFLYFTIGMFIFATFILSWYTLLSISIRKAEQKE